MCVGWVDNRTMFQEITDYSPTSLCDIINQEWHLDIRPQDIRAAPRQGRSSHVILVADMAIKFHKYSHKALKLEEEIFRHLEGNALTVDVPRVLHVSTSRAMMAMTALPGAPMSHFHLPPVISENGTADDQIIERLAQFTIDFDFIMRQTRIIHELKDGYPNFVRQLEVSNDEKSIFVTDKFQSRIMHNDFNSDNIIIGPMDSLGIIDFEAAAKCDPHFQIVPMMSYHGFGPKGCARFVEAVNGLSKSGKWLDMDRVIDLTEAYRKLAPSLFESIPRVMSPVKNIAVGSP